MNEKTEYRSSSWDKGQNGKVSGYAVVFGSRAVIYKDQVTGIEYNEEVDPHALDGADLTDVVLRVNHEGKVLARTRNGSLTLTVDSIGLRIEADMTGSEESRNVYEAVQNGLYDKMSFAFTVSEDSFDSASRTRIIRKIDRLFDVAIVDFPAYDATSVSARAKFDGFAEEDRRTFYQAENRKILDQIDELIEPFDIGDDDFSDPYNELTDKEKIYRQMQEIRTRCNNLAKRNSDLIGTKPLADLAQLRDQLYALEKNRTEIRNAIANGDGLVTKTFDNYDNTRKEKRKMDLKQISENFYNGLIEKRAATGVSGMSNVIPVEITDSVMRTRPYGLLPLISKSNIAHAGNIKIPYFTDSAVAVTAHTENYDITPSSFVPSALTISHSEYQETLGYSYLGNQLAMADLARIVEEALLGAMDKHLDYVALSTINGGTTWAKTGASQNAVQWATSGAPTLNEILTLMKLQKPMYSTGAVFIMTQATNLAIIENSTGYALQASDDAAVSNGQYNVSVVDGLTKLFGVPVVIDANMSDGDIFYGKADAVHMNIAGNIELANWLDRDSLTEKFQVACAAGFGVEAYSFVKGSNSIS